MMSIVAHLGSRYKVGPEFFRSMWVHCTMQWLRNIPETFGCMAAWMEFLTESKHISSAGTIKQLFI